MPGRRETERRQWVLHRRRGSRARDRHHLASTPSSTLSDARAASSESISRRPIAAGTRTETENSPADGMSNSRKARCFDLTTEPQPDRCRNALAERTRTTVAGGGDRRQRNSGGAAMTLVRSVEPQHVFQSAAERSGKARANRHCRAARARCTNHGELTGSWIERFGAVNANRQARESRLSLLPRATPQRAAGAPGA